jgi:hypothetical protein
MQIPTMQGQCGSCSKAGSGSLCGTEIITPHSQETIAE